MYLFHNTDIQYLYTILDDGYLKSSKITNNLGEGDGIYKTNSYIYFSTTPKLFDPSVIATCTLYFKSILLYNRRFYINNIASSSPNLTGKKYKKNYKYYNKVLQKLYNNSINVLHNGTAFQAFQQIAILNKINLVNLIGIEFTNYIPPNILTKINLMNKYRKNKIVLSIKKQNNDFTNKNINLIVKNS